MMVASPLLRQVSLSAEQIREACDLDSNGCWNKRGVRHPRYGAFSIGGILRPAHRVSWEVHFGAIPNNLYVCHRCNNKHCINPEHLYLATHRQNIVDAIRDGLIKFNNTPRGATKVNSDKTICMRGHSLEGDNLYMTPKGYRSCRICQRGRSTKFARKKRAAAKSDATTPDAGEG